MVDVLPLLVFFILDKENGVENKTLFKAKAYKIRNMLKAALVKIYEAMCNDRHNQPKKVHTHQV